MFEQYVKATWNLDQHCRAPLAQERESFLVRLREQGRGAVRVRTINARLLAIVNGIDLRDQRMVSEAELVIAANTWLAQRTRPATGATTVHKARTDFISIASEWLRFLGRLEETHTSVPFTDQLEAFLRYQREERGLAEATIFWRRRSLEGFLHWLSSQGGSIQAISPQQITAYFCIQRARPWKRATVRFHVFSLRSFFAYAASRKWCDASLAATIQAPRMYAFENLPQGPAWSDVQRLITSLSGNDPTQVRDRAVVLLLALYGFRIGEVCQLTLDDFDWMAERIRVRRSKQRRTQDYPLTAEVGEAILRYLKEVRPPSAHRTLFLRLHTPYHPLSPAGLGTIITTHLKGLGLELPHYGPHVLRHACATHLLSEGFSLKEIGDHLGHRSAAATRIYAKVDTRSLRQVADLDLSDLVEDAQRHPQMELATLPESRLLALREIARLSLGGLQ
jgi:integrase/recombinase XerD